MLHNKQFLRDNHHLSGFEEASGGPDMTTVVRTVIDWAELPLRCPLTSE